MPSAWLISAPCSLVWRLASPVAGHTSDAPVKMSQMDGKPLPNWLRYDAANKTFTANDVPAGAFPLQLKVSVGNTDSVVLIQEKPPK